MSKTYVKVFRDGDRFAIETNADDENAFRNTFAAEVHELGLADAWALGELLTPYVEICCKLRGYKSDVLERRVLSAGQVIPHKGALISRPESDSDG